MGNSICIVAPDAWAAVSGTGGKYIGGAETQQKLVADLLRSRGYDVSFLVAEPAEASANAVDIPSWLRIAYRLRARSSRTGYLRDSLKLFKAMRSTGVRIFIQRCSFHDTPRTWLFSRLLRSRFVFWVGSDYNVDPRWMDTNLSAIRRSAYLRGLRSADAVICQTEYQRSMLEKHFHLNPHVIRNLVEIPLEKADPRFEKITALWGGRLNPNKRADLLLELAEKVPAWNFLAAAVRERGHDDLYNNFIFRAESVTNLTVLAGLPHEEYLSACGRCSLTLNTSEFEGFPNSLLEGFIRSVPALTLGIDPDSIIQNHGLGWVCTDVDQAASKMKSLASNMELITDSGNRAFVYARRNHTGEMIIDHLEAVLRDLN